MSGTARSVVLLRGVNLGKANRVPMAEFRVLLERLGLSQVRTLLNSGNAVATGPRRSTAALAAAIQRALQETLAVDVPVIVHTGEEFARIVANNPIVPPADAHARFLVAFVSEPAALDVLRALEPLLSPGEQLHVSERAAYLHCTGGLLESRAASAALGARGRGVTTRNWATVLKLQAALAG